MSSPVARTLAKIREEGGHPEVVERFIPRGRGMKLDLFGIVDVEALFPDHTLYVQVCRDEDLTDHLITCLNEPRLLTLLACTGRVFEIWSWKKRGRAWSERRLNGQWTPHSVIFVEREISEETHMGPIVQTPARGGA